MIGCTSEKLDSILHNLSRMAVLGHLLPGGRKVVLFAKIIRLTGGVDGKKGRRRWKLGKKDEGFRPAEVP